MRRIAYAMLVSVVSMAPVMAESFYTALDVGQSKEKDACTGLPAGTTGCKNTASMFRLAGGYQFSPMWGAEVSYGDYGRASCGIQTACEWKVSGVQLAGTGTFPIASSFSLLGKIGVARTDLKIYGGGGGAATSTKIAYGIGAQYDFVRNISARVQYEDLGNVGDSNTGGSSKVSLLSAGIVYKF